MHARRYGLVGLERQAELENDDFVRKGLLLIADGSEKLSVGGATDYFAKFGDRSALNIRRANAFVLIGLGNWGLGNMDQAEKAFESALLENPSNFEAKIRLFDISDL